LTVLPLISLDLSGRSADAISGLKRAFLDARSFIFVKLKNQRFDEVISATNTSDYPSLDLNKGKATMLKNKGTVDKQGVFSVFAQIATKMKGRSHSSMRNSERLFKVEFVGEGGIDAGGPYNEAISHICDEL
jgi:hypothetical protein